VCDLFQDQIVKNTCKPQYWLTLVETNVTIGSFLKTLFKNVKSINNTQLDQGEFVPNRHHGGNYQSRTLLDKKV